MEPVRVKVYGLFWRTRQRYLVDSAIGLAALLAVFIAWFPGWPPLKERIATIEKYRIEKGEAGLPTYMQFTVAILDVLPLILTATALFKCLEMYLVLRAFARKEAEQTRPTTGPARGGPV
jgi:hypothetical protein